MTRQDKRSMPKIKLCIEENCKNVQTTQNFCRLHYLKNWRQIKTTSQKKAMDRLNKYVEGICKKYPEKYVDAIRRDIKGGHLDQQKPVDEALSGSETGDDLFEQMGYRDEDGIDRLLSHIKLDKDY